jgi:hypothetical protein
MKKLIIILLFLSIGNIFNLRELQAQSTQLGIFDGAANNRTATIRLRIIGGSIVGQFIGSAYFIVRYPVTTPLASIEDLLGSNGFPSAAGPFPQNTTWGAYPAVQNGGFNYVLFETTTVVQASAAYVSGGPDLDIVSFNLVGAPGQTGSIELAEDQTAADLANGIYGTDIPNDFWYSGIVPDILNSTTAFYQQSFNGPLPITLSKFEAKNNVNDCSHLIQWETVSESNVSHFELQYSPTGYDFQTIETVFTQGNGTQLNKYSFEHKIEGSSLYNYYRLKVVHSGDKAPEFSKIMSSKNNCAEIGSSNFVWNVYPNPSNGTVMAIEFTTNSSEMVQFSVLDATGKRVATYNTVNSGRFDLPIDQLAPGAYFLQYQGSNSVAPQTKKIVKF